MVFAKPSVDHSGLGCAKALGVILLFLELSKSPGQKKVVRGGLGEVPGLGGRCVGGPTGSQGWTDTLTLLR